MQPDPRVVLVTGASSGIGASCASYLASKGLRVYGASRRALAPVGVNALAMDVSCDSSVSRAVESVTEREGRLDIVVNNAGMGIAGAVEDTSIDEAKAQFEVNFFGVLRVCRATLPVLRARGSGYLINIGSIGGLIAIPYQGLYSASKFAIEGLTESLRMEVRPFGIRTVLIEPGDHRTSFTESRRMTSASKGSVYAEKAGPAVARMAKDEQNGTDPDAVGRLLYWIVNTADPRLRYTVGPAPQRAAVWLKRLLPNAVMERIMRSQYSC
jgi:NAD(P)-dependent dehydrogenase (short-subunit alcohol dehydrogenase family)